MGDTEGRRSFFLAIVILNRHDVVPRKMEAGSWGVRGSLDIVIVSGVPKSPVHKQIYSITAGLKFHGGGDS